MKADVIGIGEILIDFVASEPISYLDVSTFQKCFGGAPMNTLVGIVRLGLMAGAITAVGDDPFGHYLIEELKRNAIETSHVQVKSGVRTTITFVANEPETGERTFIFYRKPWVVETADSALSVDAEALEYIAHANILHVSGFALSQNPSRTAVMKAVHYAKKRGVMISFDPTLRVDVWSSVRTMRSIYNQMLELADVATFSREEAAFIFNTPDVEKAAKVALKHGVKIVGMKLGSSGALLATQEGEQISLPAFQVKAIDTTGAGDGWNAGLLVGLVREWDMTRCVTVANAVGALVVTKRGAITALPYRKELNSFLRQHKIPFQV